MYNGGAVMVHKPLERILEPDTPDDATWMDEGRMVVAKNERGESQGTPAGDNWMEEGEVRRLIYVEEGALLSGKNNLIILL